MSDAEYQVYVVEHVPDVVDLGLRADAEGDRQGLMVAHNEAARRQLTYSFGTKIENAAAKPQAFRSVPDASLAAKTAESTVNMALEMLPLIEYRSGYREQSRTQEQFVQGVNDAVVILMNEHNISESLGPDFKAALTVCAQSFRLQTSRVMLPERPKRDYLPGEGILHYLRSSDGFGPWIAAGDCVLTRPLIREKAPKAYTALANWLRSNELPDDLVIPTKSEALDAELVTPISVREARRIARRGDRHRVS